jgi:hypothetical protein
VSSHELSSIQGLEDKHLRALARHGVTDVRGLVQADPEVIYRAMANLRPRSPRDLVARWQADARSMLAETAPDVAEWQMVASFVVVFFQRRTGDTWERRVEAERTEVEPERNPQVWPAWETGPVWDWMLGQLGQASGAEPASGDATAGETTQPAEEDAGAAEPPPGRPAAERPALRIDSAVIIDAAGRTNVVAAGAVAAGAVAAGAVAAGAVAAGAVAAGPPRELVAPARVAFTVSGAPPGSRLWAVARVLRRDGPGWNARDPVAVPGSGEVEFDLSAVSPGDHDVGLIAWAPDATAKPVSVRLPAITIRSG